MIRRITLENYMSHVMTVIEPADDLTVLVGPNNSGKSAIVHALQTLCYNRPNDFAIRHDQKEATITVETEDGQVLKWRRKRGGAVSYEINGESFYRLGQGGVPEKLHACLRMPKIEPAEGDPFFVHFGLQKSPLFLLNETASRAATFFASSSDAEKLLQMQRRHRDKARDANRDLAACSRDLHEREQTIEATSPLTQLAEEMQRIESSYGQIVETARNIDQMAAQVVRLKEAERAVAQHRDRLAALKTLSAPPVYFETGRLRSMVDAVRKSSEQCAVARLRERSLESLQPPPVLRDTASLGLLVQRLNRLRDAARNAAGRLAALAPLAAPPVLKDDARLQAHLRRLSDSIDRVNRERESGKVLAALPAPLVFEQTQRLRDSIAAARGAEARVGRYAAGLRSLMRLSAPPPPLASEPLQGTVARMKACLGQLQGHRKALPRLVEEVASVRDQIRQWAGENPRCPLCGAPTDADAVLQGVHAHGR